MRAVGNHRGARPISLALVAGLVAFEAVLALGTGAVGIPGVLLVRLAGGSGGAGATATSEAPEGGESVFAKLSSAPAISTPKPTPADEAAGAVPSAPRARAPSGQGRGRSPRGVNGAREARRGSRRARSPLPVLGRAAGRGEA